MVARIFMHYFLYSTYVSSAPWSQITCTSLSYRTYCQWTDLQTRLSSPSQHLPTSHPPTFNSSLMTNILLLATKKLCKLIQSNLFIWEWYNTSESKLWVYTATRHFLRLSCNNIMYTVQGTSSDLLNQYIRSIVILDNSHTFKVKKLQSN